MPRFDLPGFALVELAPSPLEEAEAPPLPPGLPMALWCEEHGAAFVTEDDDGYPSWCDDCGALHCAFGCYAEPRRIVPAEYAPAPEPPRPPPRERPLCERCHKPVERLATWDKDGRAIVVVVVTCHGEKERTEVARAELDGVLRGTAFRR